MHCRHGKIHHINKSPMGKAAKGEKHPKKLSGAVAQARGRCMTTRQKRHRQLVVSNTLQCTGYPQLIVTRAAAAAAGSPALSHSPPRSPSAWILGILRMTKHRASYQASMNRNNTSQSDPVSCCCLQLPGCRLRQPSSPADDDAAGSAGCSIQPSFQTPTPFLLYLSLSFCPLLTHIITS